MMKSYVPNHDKIIHVFAKLLVGRYSRSKQHILPIIVQIFLLLLNPLLVIRPQHVLQFLFLYRVLAVQSSPTFR